MKNTGEMSFCIGIDHLFGRNRNVWWHSHIYHTVRISITWFLIMCSYQALHQIRVGKRILGRNLLAWRTFQDPRARHPLHRPCKKEIRTMVKFPQRELSGLRWGVRNSCHTAKFAKVAVARNDSFLTEWLLIPGWLVSSMMVGMLHLFLTWSSVNWTDWKTVGSWSTQ